MVPAQKEFAERAKAARARMAHIALVMERDRRRSLESECVRARTQDDKLSDAEALHNEFVYLSGLSRACENRLPKPAITPANTKRRLTLIMEEVAAKHGFNAAEILSPRRQVRLCIARQEFYWRAQKETSASYPAIGRFCNRDHSSVIVGARQHEARMAGTSISRVKGAPKISLAQRKPEHRPCAHSSAAISTGAAPGFPADPLSTSQDA